MRKLPLSPFPCSFRAEAGDCREIFVRIHGHRSFYDLLLPARRYARAGNNDRNVSVCPSVRHTPVLCQNEES